MKDLARAIGLLVAANLCAIAAAPAAEYCVSPSGDDGGPGSRARPWKTLAKANAVLKAGDTVHVRQGAYRERIEPKNSGAKDRPIVYRAFEGETPVVVGAGDNAATLSGNDYITLRGLTLDGKDKIFCGIYMEKEADYVTVRDCIIKNFRNAKNTGGYGIWVNRKGGSHLTVENCKIFHCGTTNPKIENGSNIHVFRDSSHITIRGCDIYESYTEDGLHLGAFGLVTDVLVENCRFWGCKENGIDMKNVARVTVRGCELWGSKPSPTGGGAEVVVHMGARDVTFEDCRFHHGRDGLRIGYNAHSIDVPPTQNIRVARCAFYDCKVGVIVAGGFTRQPAPGKCRNISFYNNVFFGNDYGLELWAHPGCDVRDVDFRNNIFAGNKKGPLEIRADRVKGLTRDYNNYPGHKAQAAREKHGLSVDPQFVNAAKRDFTLRPSSPMIDKGVKVGLPFAGDAPDMGLYERNLKKKAAPGAR